MATLRTKCWASASLNTRRETDSSFPGIPYHRQDGAGLDDDFEELAALIVEIQQIAREDQVTGGRNREKFGGPSTTRG